MAEEKIKEEQGVGTPSLSDNKEGVSNTVEVLESKVQDLETSMAEKDSKILELEDLVKVKDSEIKKLEKKVGKPKGVVAKKDQDVIRFLLSPAGKFKLPYNVGQEVAMDKEVAAEIVESRYAEYVK